MADILIIGYGPAGISAALYGLRAGLDVVIVGKDGGALSKAHLIQNYFGLEHPLTGEELLEVGKKQAQNLGAQIINAEITDLMFNGKEFLASDSNGISYSGKSCILATGSARKKRAVQGMANLEGHGISYCAVCDGFFYREKNVAVLGSGEYALHEIQELLPLVHSVTLLTGGATLNAKFPDSIKIDKRPLKQVLGNDTFKGVLFEDESETYFDGLFVAIGSASATDLAQKAGAAFENGNLVLDENFQTSIPGLYAAGDCTGGTLQIAVAVGEGAKAALSAIKFLREAD